METLSTRIPAHARIEKTYTTRYRLPAGKTKTGRQRYKYVSKEQYESAPGPKLPPVSKESRYYYAVFDRTVGSKRKRTRINLKLTDKEAAKQKLALMLKEGQHMSVGLISVDDLTNQTEIQVAKQQYIDELTREGRKPRYVEQVERLIRTIIEKTGMRTVGDMTPDALKSHLDSRKCSARTKNTYIIACKGLLSHLVEQGKLNKNPLERMTRYGGAIVRKRRALPLDQIQKLIEAARRRPLAEMKTVHRGPRKGQQVVNLSAECQERWDRVGRERALLYMTALHTGLRFRELAEVNVAHLRLDESPPLLYLPGCFTKNGKDVQMPLGDELVNALREWIELTRKKGTDKVFDIREYTQICKTLRKDLAYAGIPYRAADGRYFDFHAFRKCTGTYLRLAKVDPALAMKYMRHSDIKLTMEIYSDDSLLDMTEAAKAIPKLAV